MPGSADFAIVIAQAAGRALIPAGLGRLAYCWSMILSENRYPPRIKSGAGFFGIML
jgi:hypothetical protein